MPNTSPFDNCAAFSFSAGEVTRAPGGFASARQTTNGTNSLDRSRYTVSDLKGFIELLRMSRIGDTTPILDTTLLDTAYFYNLHLFKCILSHLACLVPFPGTATAFISSARVRVCHLTPKCWLCHAAIKMESPRSSTQGMSRDDGRH